MVDCEDQDHFLIIMINDHHGTITTVLAGELSFKNMECRGKMMWCTDTKGANRGLYINCQQSIVVPSFHSTHINAGGTEPKNGNLAAKLYPLMLFSEAEFTKATIHNAWIDTP